MHLWCGRCDDITNVCTGGMGLFMVCAFSSLTNRLVDGAVMASAWVLCEKAQAGGCDRRKE